MRCLESVLKQNVSSMEIICVDDGSTDGSGELLDLYASLDSRIKVIHKENNGLVRARKIGITAAQGKYVGYVDSDDWIEPNMYEVLCGIAERYETDLVSSGYILEKGAKINFFDGFPEGLYENDELTTLRNCIFFNKKNRNIGIRPSLCNKLFRTSIMKKVQLAVPDEITNCEDRICTVAYMLEINSIYILKEAFYHYVFHNESMSHYEDINYLDKLGIVYRSFKDMYTHPKFSEQLRLQCELYLIKMVIDGLNEHLGFLISDLMWINPTWIEKFPLRSKILLYGAGRLGKVYYRQITSDRANRLLIAEWIDKNYQNLKNYPQEIKPPECIRSAEYDYILIALIDKEPADKIREWLINEFNVCSEKIVWIEQHEIFWDYAKAAGLLEEEAGYETSKINKQYY